MRWPVTCVDDGTRTTAGPDGVPLYQNELGWSSSLAETGELPDRNDRHRHGSMLDAGTEFQRSSCVRSAPARPAGRDFSANMIGSGSAMAMRTRLAALANRTYS
ncbi:hypothetical protein ACIBG0_37340 [Nocardia sp. NPDC050630]|uniref:hypothetical protein n=1 Tax=Nocardia sp. NPDC050630 TaxID=3364321 RepID=UPI0037A4CBBA